MQAQRIVGEAAWLDARRILMDEEKALLRAHDRLAAKRRELPWMRVEKDYAFQSEAGAVSLPDLFEGREQLIVWHFMFGADWTEGCPSCSFWADQYSPALPHLHDRGVSLAAVSTAPVERLIAYRDRMGWAFPWVSSGGTDFNRDFGVTFAEDETGAAPLYNFGTLPAGGRELPGLTVFAMDDDGAVHRTYSAYARGLDSLNGAYQLLDLVPKGRDEDGLPWPMAWLRRRDQYE